ncbi:hypothetical protein FA95DRAFT_1561665 [Auriscalpium vulgare]|uniref:Uncharacterized protein n=1 Tax=Auriscalpium vulgare TaxID=40419 RepID=A0ACB8RLZ1_9AGAM|nr:hypothetical protein FA95DRAFT_1561665 [Auriscalpium vulgare]
MSTPSIVEKKPLATRDGLQAIGPAEMNRDRYGASSEAQFRQVPVFPAMFTAFEPAPVELGMASSPPQYMPAGWKRYVHPEGKPYFYRRTHPAIATTVDVREWGALEEIDAWATVITEWAAELGIVLPQSVEIFLDFDFEGPGYPCKYYFVDHAAKVPFWLTTTNTDDLDVFGVYNEEHLKLNLESLYWDHVQTFSMHNRCDPEVLDNLILRFLHARVDDMTSDLSTFPYREPMSAQILDVLQHCKNHISDGRVMTIVARMQTLLLATDIQLLWGQKQARLSIDQSVFESPTVKRSILLKGVSLLCFNYPECWRARLEGLFVDSIAYDTRWDAFNTEMLQEWKAGMAWSFGALISNILTLPTAFSPATTQTSLILSAVSILGAILLSQRHMDPKLRNKGWKGPCDFLTEHRSDYEFRPIAIVLTLPKALYTWALILFVVQAMCQALHDVRPAVLGAVLGLVAALGLAALMTMYPIHLVSRLRRAGVRVAACFSCCRSRRAESDDADAEPESTSTDEKSGDSLV